MPEDNDVKSNNSSTEEVKTNGDLFGFLERMLTPIVSVNQSRKEEDKSSESDERVAQLQAEIEELKRSIDSKSTEETTEETPESSESQVSKSTESSESSESTVQESEETQPITPAFPQPRGEGGEFKSYREKYEELVTRSPRKAAKYFQENGIKILEGVRFFGE